MAKEVFNFGSNLKSHRWYVSCTCGNPTDTICVDVDIIDDADPAKVAKDWEPDCSFYATLNPGLGFWDRVRNLHKYLFNPLKLFNNGSHMLNEEGARQIRDAMDQFLAERERHRSLVAAKQANKN